MIKRFQAIIARREVLSRYPKRLESQSVLAWIRFFMNPQVIYYQLPAAPGKSKKALTRSGDYDYTENIWYFQQLFFICHRQVWYYAKKVGYNVRHNALA